MPTSIPDVLLFLSVSISHVWHIGLDFIRLVYVSMT